MHTAFHLLFGEQQQRKKQRKNLWTIAIAHYDYLRHHRRRHTVINDQLMAHFCAYIPSIYTNVSD